MLTLQDLGTTMRGYSKAAKMSNQHQTTPLFQVKSPNFGSRASPTLVIGLASPSTPGMPLLSRSAVWRCAGRVRLVPGIVLVGNYPLVIKHG